MNKVYLIGNLTRDPEISTTTSGISVCRMSIAVGRRFTNAEGGRETDFFNVTAWRGTADNCAKFLKKGNKVAVSGSIQTRNYEKADGTELVMDTTSGGGGYYISNGALTEIRWSIDEVGNLIFRLLDGEKLTVNPGTSYIGYYKASNASKVKIN